MTNLPLLLLHGTLAEQHQFDSLAFRLGDTFQIHRLDFEGHGNKGETDRPFRVEHFAENVLTYLDTKEISKVNIFGYSMGGYIALFLAKKVPERINRIATLGTILEWDEEKVLTETVYLHPDKMEEKVPHFIKKMEKRHKADWKIIVNKTRELFEHLGRKPSIKKEEWREFTQPIRLHVGDRDNTAGVESSHTVYVHLDHGELAVLPRTPHPLNQVNEQWLMVSLTEFFRETEK